MSSKSKIYWLLNNPLKHRSDIEKPSGCCQMFQACMLRAIDYHDNNGSGIICSNCSFGWIITDASIRSSSVRLRRGRRGRETIYLLSRSFYLKVKLFFVYMFWSHSLNINQVLHYSPSPLHSSICTFNNPVNETTTSAYWVK